MNKFAKNIDSINKMIFVKILFSEFDFAAAKKVGRCVYLIVDSKIVSTSAAVMFFEVKLLASLRSQGG